MRTKDFQDMLKQAIYLVNAIIDDSSFDNSYRYLLNDTDKTFNFQKNIPIITKAVRARKIATSQDATREPLYLDQVERLFNQIQGWADFLDNKAGAEEASAHFAAISQTCDALKKIVIIPVVSGQFRRTPAKRERHIELFIGGVEKHNKALSEYAPLLVTRTNTSSTSISSPIVVESKLVSGTAGPSFSSLSDFSITISDSPRSSRSSSDSSNDGQRQAPQSPSLIDAVLPNGALVVFSDMQTPSDSLKAQVVKLKTENGSLAAEKQQLAQEMAQLQSNFNTLQSGVFRVTQEKGGLEVKIKVLEQQNSELNNNYQRLQKDSHAKSSELLQQINATEAESDERGMRLKDQQLAVDLAEQQKSLSDAQLIQLKEQYATFKTTSAAQAAALQTRIDTVSAELGALQLQLTNLEAEKAQLAAAKELLSQQAVMLQQSLDQKNAEVDATKTSLSQEQQAKNDQAAQLAETQRQLQEAQEKNQALEDEKGVQLDQHKQQLKKVEQARDKQLNILNEVLGAKPFATLSEAKQQYQDAITALKKCIENLNSQAQGAAMDKDRQLAKDQLKIVEPYLKKMERIKDNNTIVLTAGAKALHAVEKKLTDPNYDETEFKLAMMNFASLPQVKTTPGTGRKLSAIAVATICVLFAVGIICICSVHGTLAGVAMIITALKMGSTGVFLGKLVVPIVATTGGVTAGGSSTAGIFAGKKVWQSGNTDLRSEARDVMHKLPVCMKRTRSA